MLRNFLIYVLEKLNWDKKCSSFLPTILISSNTLIEISLKQTQKDLYELMHIFLKFNYKKAILSKGKLAN